MYNAQTLQAVIFQNVFSFLLFSFNPIQTVLFFASCDPGEVGGGGLQTTPLYNLNTARAMPTKITLNNVLIMANV